VGVSLVVGHDPACGPGQRHELLGSVVSFPSNHQPTSVEML
jgi:hypothetical protein